MNDVQKEAVRNGKLCELQARNIMSSPVLTAQESWSVKMLLDFFVSHHISGAPVVNDQGQLTGVVSMTDVVRFENLSVEEKARMVAVSCYSDYFDFAFAREDMARMMQNADTNCSVSQIMTQKVVQVGADTTMPEVAALMRQHHIHRVFVCEEGRAIGVISTTNMLDVLIASCNCPV